MVGAKNRMFNTPSGKIVTVQDALKAGKLDGVCDLLGPDQGVVRKDLDIERGPFSKAVAIGIFGSVALLGRTNTLGPSNHVKDDKRSPGLFPLLVGPDHSGIGLDSLYPSDQGVLSGNRQPLHH